VNLSPSLPIDLSSRPIRRSSVYIMVSDDEGVMKVGWASCSISRASQLRNGANVFKRPIPDLRVAFAIETYNPLEIERYLHGALDRQRGASEWFPLNYPLVAACVEDAWRFFSRAWPELLSWSPHNKPWPCPTLSWRASV